MNQEQIRSSLEEKSQASALRKAESHSFWLAVAIALAPFPASLLVTWALGAPPPWRPRTPVSQAPAGPHAGHDHSTGPAHR